MSCKPKAENDGWGVFIASVVIGLLAIICAISWTFNMVYLAGMDGFSGLMVLRVIGIFIFPIGIVLGFI